MNKIEVDGYKRVQKRTAENLYKEGQTVYLLPVNMRPDNPWQKPFVIQKDDHEEWPSNNFNPRINAYSYYNCQVKQLGQIGRAHV